MVFFCTARCNLFVALCSSSSAVAKSWGSQHKCFISMGNDLHMLQLLRTIFSKSRLIDAMVNWRLKVQGSIILCFISLFSCDVCTSDNQVWSLDPWWSVSVSGSVVDLILWFLSSGFLQAQQGSRTQCITGLILELQTQTNWISVGSPPDRKSVV